MLSTTADASAVGSAPAALPMSDSRAPSITTADASAVSTTADASAVGGAPAALPMSGSRAPSTTSADASAVSTTADVSAVSTAADTPVSGKRRARRGCARRAGAQVSGAAPKLAPKPVAKPPGRSRDSRARGLRPPVRVFFCVSCCVCLCGE